MRLGRAEVVAVLAEARSVNAPASVTVTVQGPFVPLAKSFVGDVEEVTQIKALALVFLLGDDFRVIVGRIDQTRDALQLLLAGIF